MSGHYWAQVLAQLALQHLWLGAVLAIVALVVSKLRRRIGAEACSWILAAVFALAVVSPFAIFLPQGTMPASSAQGWFSVTASPARALANDLQPVAGFVQADAIASARFQKHAFDLHGLGMVALAVWLVGFAWMSYRLWASWLVADRLRRSSRRRPDLEQHFAQVLPGKVTLRVSGRVSGPMLVGLLRPCVLLPGRLLDELSLPELRFAVLHELAHVRRRDPWVSLFQALGLVVFWWSPWLRFVGARLDAIREMACDERAAAQSGDAVACADALLTTAGKISIPGHAGVLAAGMLHDRKTLNQRIEGLLQMNAAHRVSNKVVAVGCSMLVLSSISLAVLATPRVGGMPSAPPVTVSGAEPARASAADAKGLIEAVQTGRADVIKRLVSRGANVNARLPGDGTALIVAAKRGDVDSVNALIELGADVNEASPGDGNPLIAAAAKGRLGVAKRLVEAGADVNANVEYDETPLINAARSGSLPMVEYLVDKKADVNLGVLADGHRWRSPLNQASTDAIREYLKSRGAVARR